MADPVDRDPAGAVIDFEVDGQLWRAIGRAAGLGLLVGLAVLLFGHLAGLPLRGVLAVGIPVTIAVLAQLVRSTVADMVELDQSPAPAPSPTADYFRTLRQLERRLEGASRDGSKYDRGIRPELVRLAVDRLRQKHAINPVREPDRARAILGEQLWLLTTNPQAQDSPAPGRRQLQELIVAIEAI